MHFLRSVLCLVLMLLMLFSAALAEGEVADGAVDVPAGALSEQAVYELALSLVQGGDVEAAVLAIEEALPALPDSVLLNKLLGDIHYAYSQYPKSYEAYHRAAELEPDNYEHFLCEADALYFQGLFAQACDSFSKAIELNPTMGYLYGCRGDAYYMQDDFDKALEDFEKQITLGTSASDALARKAFAKEALGRELPYPKGEESVSVNTEANAALTAYFEGQEIPSQETILSCAVLAQIKGLPYANLFFPELKISAEGNASADYPILDGIWINVPFDEKKQVMGYILYQIYDEPLYTHAAKFADTFLEALFDQKPPVTYAALKKAQFAQRRWEPLPQSYGDAEITLYFMDSGEALLVRFP